MKSKLNILFYNATHNYDYNTFKQYLSQALDTPRDLYQGELWGTISTSSAWNTENKITYHMGSIPRYFWVEAINSDLSKPENFNFHAKINGNTINLDLMSTPVQTKTLRIYLNTKMMNLNQPVSIVMNQNLVATWLPPHVRLFKRRFQLKSMDPTDPQFLFDDFIDVSVPAATATLPKLSKR